MGNVKSLEDARQARRERARIGEFSEPVDVVDIAMPVERTSDGMRRVAIMAPDYPNSGWSLTPDQADELAAFLVAEAAAARGAK